uniref:ATP synthase F0 subunit 8 n=1 Tax=Daboia russelii TaxID=8707 RepID=B6DAB2_DABRR|nr:ATP synthase F0 subunit 8 [Daboia russelii]ACF60284.1 ATP synthase F0 subunit 8 [Daboia russelii]
MPQLDIVYICYTYLWTWFIITLMSQKMDLFKLTIKPKYPFLMKHQLSTSTLPWT